MTENNGLQSFIDAAGDESLPPVEQWDPPYCGEMDLLIRADGEWLYQNSPIARHRLKVLFSRVIKKEGSDYFLVTPVEKVKITVEWQPFVIIDFGFDERSQCYWFIDNCDNRMLLNEESQWQFDYYQGQWLPIIKVRRNLFAAFSRNCYYRLIEHQLGEELDDPSQLVIVSNQLSFPLYRAD